MKYIMPNTISDNYSTSNSTFGFDGGLADLTNTDASDDSVKIVDLFSKEQQSFYSPAGTKTENSIFSSTSTLNLQSTETSSPNLDTTKYGVVGTGATNGDPKYEGDKGRDFKALTKNISETKSDMYSQVDTKLDGIFGKGQYTKPENHYQYVQTIASAMKMMSPEQKEQFKNDLEKIGQPFHTNFGLSRTRVQKTHTTNVALNTYMVGAFNGEQATEQVRMREAFFAERDAAIGRAPRK
jgi:hypothetical protein